jgi:hypothetical protein
MVSETPHTTEQGCIEALTDEIARTREVLEHVKRPPAPQAERDPDKTEFV